MITYNLLSFVIYQKMTYFLSCPVEAAELYVLTAKGTQEAVRQQGFGGNSNFPPFRFDALPGSSVVLADPAVVSLPTTVTPSSSADSVVACVILSILWTEAKIVFSLRGGLSRTVLIPCLHVLKLLPSCFKALDVGDLRRDNNILAGADNLPMLGTGTDRVFIKVCSLLLYSLCYVKSHVEQLYAI